MAARAACRSTSARASRSGGCTAAPRSAFAETLASVASVFVVDRTQKTIVGLEINANHLRGVTDGWVTGTARPLHIGRTTMVWEVRIEDETGRAVCISRCTIAVIDLPRKSLSLTLSILLSRADLDFLLYDWLKVDELTARERYADHSRDTFDATLDLAEAIATPSISCRTTRKPTPTSRVSRTARS